VPPASPPRVSAIIGTWNRARYLGQAISSILRQTVEDLELIVADDGSTDETADVVRGFEDERVRHLPGPHSGISRNLNRALEAARAPYVALLDSDDWSYPPRLERQAAVLDARPEVAVVGHRMLEVDGNGRELSPRVTFAAGDVNFELMHFNPISNSCAMLRREAALAVGGFDPAYRCAVDWNLWLRIADRHVVHSLDEVLGVRRMHESNISVRQERAQIRAGLRTRVATMRRRRSLRGAHGLTPATISYMTPIALKRVRRRRLGQAV
jgi:glycosyltransferase involved in cell wall biosynthesis